MQLISPAQCLAHDPGHRHPEQPARLATVLKRLAADFPQLSPVPAAPATLDHLRRVHSEALVARLEAMAPADGLAGIDADTIMSPGSLAAALCAAGAVIAGVDRVLETSLRRVFCAVRPPGHHAESQQAMGFCLFNSVAAGAAHALASGLQRVSVVDFDVHHGNGTQQIFYSEPRVQYLSSHQMPLYPGSGGRAETGAGNIVNEPLSDGSGSAEFRAAWDGVLLPALDRFAPQLILVSAGFDAHRADPLGGLDVETEDFAWLTRRLLNLALTHCDGRLVSALEGGYDLPALADSVSAHVRELATFQNRLEAGSLSDLA